MEVDKISVGDQYPDDLSTLSGEGLWPRIVMGGLHLVVLLDLKEGDLQKFSRQKVQIGVKVENHIPFVTLYLKRWGCLDGHVNPLQYNKDWIGRYLAEFGNLFTIVVVDRETQVVRHLRGLGMSMKIANATLQGIQTARKHYDDPHKLEEGAQEVYSRYDRPDDLAAACTEKFVVDPGI